MLLIKPVILDSGNPWRISTATTTIYITHHIFAAAAAAAAA